MRNTPNARATGNKLRSLRSGVALARFAEARVEHDGFRSILNANLGAFIVTECETFSQFFARRVVALSGGRAERTNQRIMFLIHVKVLLWIANELRGTC